MVTVFATETQAYIDNTMSVAGASDRVARCAIFYYTVSVSLAWLRT